MDSSLLRCSLVSLLWLGGCLPAASSPTPASAPAVEAAPTPAEAEVKPPSSPSRAELQARYRSEVEPFLLARCGACHRGGPATSPYDSMQFLGQKLTEDSYDAITNLPLLFHGGAEGTEPKRSRLYGKALDGHGGTAATGSELDALAAWMGLELTFHVGGPCLITPSLRPRVAPFLPRAGAVRFELGRVDSAWEGLAVTAELALLDGGLEIRDLRVLNEGFGAGKTTEDMPGPWAFRVLHPRLIIWRGGEPQPDPADSLSEVDLTVKPGAAAVLPPGLVVLSGLRGGDAVSLQF